MRLFASLTFLWPRIIPAIVDSTAPADLTVTSLAKALPDSQTQQEPRDLTKRLSEPAGKNGVQQNGQHPMAAAMLITGANRGLGFEFASQYLADGWRVFAACRNPDAASKLRCLAQDTGAV